jgi:hypothetical protein
MISYQILSSSFEILSYHNKDSMDEEKGIKERGKK